MSAPYVLSRVHRTRSAALPAALQLGLRRVMRADAAGGAAARGDARQLRADLPGRGLPAVHLDYRPLLFVEEVWHQTLHVHHNSRCQRGFQKTRLLRQDYQYSKIN